MIPNFQLDANDSNKIFLFLQQKKRLLQSCTPAAAAVVPAQQYVAHGAH
jgi:hypothetical protein